MSPEECAVLADLAAARGGLKLDADQPGLIETRLAPLARREGFASASELGQALQDPANERLAQAAVEALACGETRFFRDRPILERLWREVVPELARRREGPVRVWSAGCATGQEIYSLAMLQAEAPAPTGRVELFASDFCERALERARSGVYTSFEVQQGLSARQLVRHFENREDRFQLARALRQDVRWRRVNLLDDLSPLGGFDVVLCRNVLGGMAEGARRRVLDALAAVVAPDGVLVLGEGEVAASPKFQPFPTFGGVYHLAREVAAAA